MEGALLVQQHLGVGGREGKGAILRCRGDVVDVHDPRCHLLLEPLLRVPGVHGGGVGQGRAGDAARGLRQRRVETEAEPDVGGQELPAADRSLEQSTDEGLGLLLGGRRLRCRLGDGADLHEQGAAVAERPALGQLAGVVHAPDVRAEDLDLAARGRHPGERTLVGPAECSVHDDTVVVGDYVADLQRGVGERRLQRLEVLDEPLAAARTQPPVAGEVGGNQLGDLADPPLVPQLVQAASGPGVRVRCHDLLLVDSPERARRRMRLDAARSMGRTPISAPDSPVRPPLPG